MDVPISFCENYRQARREIVHEKAHLDKTTIRFAQKEAESAITMITEIANFFKLKFG